MRCLVTWRCVAWSPGDALPGDALKMRHLEMRHLNRRCVGDALRKGCHEDSQGDVPCDRSDLFCDRFGGSCAVVSEVALVVLTC